MDARTSHTTTISLGLLLLAMGLAAGTLLALRSPWEIAGVLVLAAGCVMAYAIGRSSGTHQEFARVALVAALPAVGWSAAMGYRAFQ